MVGVLRWHLDIHKQWSICGRGHNESSLRRQRKNKKQAAVRRAVDRGLEMLHNSESIQIKWLFRMERAISLTLDFNHLSLLRHFSVIIGDFRNNKIFYLYIY